MKNNSSNWPKKAKWSKNKFMLKMKEVMERRSFTTVEQYHNKRVAKMVPKLLAL